MNTPIDALLCAAWLTAAVVAIGCNQPPEASLQPGERRQGFAVAVVTTQGGGRPDMASHGPCMAWCALGQPAALLIHNQDQTV